MLARVVLPPSWFGLLVLGQIVGFHSDFDLQLNLRIARERESFLTWDTAVGTGNSQKRSRYGAKSAGEGALQDPGAP